jgi:hypothetical protein
MPRTAHAWCRERVGRELRRGGAGRRSGQCRRSLHGACDGLSPISHAPLAPLAAPRREVCSTWHSREVKSAAAPERRMARARPNVPRKTSLQNAMVGTRRSEARRAAHFQPKGKGRAQVDEPSRT